MKNLTTTAVVFRIMNKEVIALFPYDVQTKTGLVSSYEHVGQHGMADYKHCIAQSKPAKPVHYNELKNELENSCGYTLKVLQKINGQNFNKAYSNFRTKRVKHFA